MKKSAKELEKEEQEEKLQVKTFTNWANSKLKERGLQMTSILTDFNTGVNLINLVEVITHKSLGRYSKEPKGKIHCVENCSKAIQFLMNNENINLVNVSGNDIADGNKKIILGLMWMLILCYQVQRDPSSGGNNGGGGGGSAKADLMDWVRSKIGGGSSYGYSVDNFTTDWNDGRRIMALVDACTGSKGICSDHNSLSLSPLEKAKKALSAAEQHMGCPILISAEDMTDPNIDELSMMTYLSYFRALEGKTTKVVKQNDDEKNKLQAELQKAKEEQEKLAKQMQEMALMNAKLNKKMDEDRMEKEKRENELKLQGQLQQEQLLLAQKQQQLKDQQALLEQQKQQQMLQQQLLKQQQEMAALQASLAEKERLMKLQQEEAARLAQLKAQQEEIIDVDDDDDDDDANDRPITRPSNLPPTVVLIVGESGHGKSTFINAVANYFLRGSYTKLRVVIETKFLPQTETRFSANKANERSSKNTSQSQTDNCFAYDFIHPTDGRKFVFIDSPGLGDTRGMGQDELNIKKIVEFAASVGSLAGIVIIINGMVSRLTTHMRKTLVTLRGHIPDVMLQNIVIVFTMCSNRTRTFDLTSLKELGDGFDFDLQNTSHIYHVQNSFFASDPRRWNDEDKEEIDKEFTTSMKTIEKIINKVGNLEQVNTKVFSDMQDMQNGIKGTLHKAKLEMSRLQRLHDDLVSAEKALGDNCEDANAFKNYMKTTKVKRIVVIPDKGYHSTVCAQCNFTCHEKCGLDEVKGEHLAKGNNIFIRCLAMNGKNNCCKCPGSCHFSHHYHSRQGIQEIETDVTSEIAEMKRRFMAAQQGIKQTQGQIDYVQQAKDDTERAVNELIQQITRECQHLKSICSGFNFVDELNQTIEEMKKDASKLKSAEAREAAQKVILAITKVATNLSK